MSWIWVTAGLVLYTLVVFGWGYYLGHWHEKERI